MTERHEISSSTTFLWKDVFPLVWITGFGGATLLLWLADPAGFHPAPLPAEIKSQFLAAWLLGSTLILWQTAQLKSVSIEGTDLLVSNYLHEARIPAHLIDKVWHRRWVSPRTIQIRFRQETPFGKRVAFVPKGGSLFREHPIVAELRAASREATRLRSS